MVHVYQSVAVVFIVYVNDTRINVRDFNYELLDSFTHSLVREIWLNFSQPVH